MVGPPGVGLRGNVEVFGDLLMVFIAVVAAILVAGLVFGLAIDTVEMLRGIIDAIEKL